MFQVNSAANAIPARNYDVHQGSECSACCGELGRSRTTTYERSSHGNGNEREADDADSRSRLHVVHVRRSRVRLGRVGIKCVVSSARLGTVHVREPRVSYAPGTCSGFRATTVRNVLHARHAPIPRASSPRSASDVAMSTLPSSSRPLLVAADDATTIREKQVNHIRLVVFTNVAHYPHVLRTRSGHTAATDMDFFVGVDVGTGSVRAALVTSGGKIKRVATCPLEIFHPAPNFYEQSSDNIWSAVCHVVKSVVADISAEDVKGIGFDATCSLVAVDEAGSPVTVSPTGQEKQNVILWMDHRAHEEADLINSMVHDILQYVGGKVSLEMQTPKMLWLKKNLPVSWNSAALLFDLPDFLTWKATESESRSLCSLVCKWNYSANPNGRNGWDEDFFEQLNLRDLKKDNWRKIGNDVRVPGDAIESGLSVKAAAELGLLKDTPVGTSLIDAHAGDITFGSIAYSRKWSKTNKNTGN
ncbi:FGGY carbohydrate kinase domain-containing protein [Temnothorax longispinosus]|uniref:FGGY carbohydrate kinase domain-containing protein n=1 Tax=Temnothorax longispinosus TaxID=300112 RepID=A0A4S2JS74_9HYME|nr:FGGY carbohydrate kinase domain-containing protein [Temnothorax longispinosus]